MLEWNQNLYISKRASRFSKRTIHRINQGKATPGVYVLTYPSNENNVMDIVSTVMLLQKTTRRRCPKILGLANGREDALELMQKILLETYEQTGNFHVKDYLESRR